MLLSRQMFHSMKHKRMKPQMILMLVSTPEHVTYDLSTDVFDSKFLLCDKVIQFAVLISVTEYIHRSISDNFTGKVIHAGKRYIHYFNSQTPDFQTNLNYGLLSPLTPDCLRQPHCGWPISGMTNLNMIPTIIRDLKWAVCQTAMAIMVHWRDGPCQVGKIT